MTTTDDRPHDRRRYQRGCRCADCCAANRAYARDRKRAKQSQLRAVPPPADPAPPPQPGEDLGGPVVAAVAAQFDGTAIAQERPGLYAIAIRLAQLLDRDDAVPQHAAAAHRLSVILGTLAQTSQRRGRLAVVRNMTPPGH